MTSFELADYVAKTLLDLKEILIELNQSTRETIQDLEDSETIVLSEAQKLITKTFMDLDEEKQLSGLSDQQAFFMVFKNTLQSFLEEKYNGVQNKDTFRRNLSVHIHPDKLKREDTAFEILFKLDQVELLQILLNEIHEDSYKYSLTLKKIFSEPYKTFDSVQTEIIRLHKKKKYKFYVFDITMYWLIEKLFPYVVLGVSQGIFLVLGLVAFNLFSDRLLGFLLNKITDNAFSELVSTRTMSFKDSILRIKWTYQAFYNAIILENSKHSRPVSFLIKVLQSLLLPIAMLLTLLNETIKTPLLILDYTGLVIGLLSRHLMHQLPKIVHFSLSGLSSIQLFVNSIINGIEMLLNSFIAFFKKPTEIAFHPNPIKQNQDLIEKSTEKSAELPPYITPTSGSYRFHETIPDGSEKPNQGVTRHFRSP